MLRTLTGRCTSARRLLLLRPSSTPNALSHKTKHTAIIMRHFSSTQDPKQSTPSSTATTPPSSPPSPSSSPSSSSPSPSPSSSRSSSSPSSPSPSPSPSPIQRAATDSGRARSEQGRGGTSGFLLVTLLATLGLGGYGFYHWQTDPNFPEKLLSQVDFAIDYVKKKLESLTASSAKEPKLQQPPPLTIEPREEKIAERKKEREEKGEEAVPVEIAEILQPVVLEEADKPPPLLEPSTSEVSSPSSEIPPSGSQLETLPTETPTSIPTYGTEPPVLLVEEIVATVDDPIVARLDDLVEVVPVEIVHEFLEKPAPAPSQPLIDFQEVLKEQAAQLEALKEKLSHFEGSQHQQTVDLQSFLQSQQSQAAEQAFREVLDLHDRVHRKELAEKLEQAYREAEQKHAAAIAELKSQYESQLIQDRSEIQAHFQEQYEQAKAELQKNMEDSLKNAIESAHAQYSIKLAEEINNFDSKLVGEMANQELKYTADHTDRMKAIAKMQSEIIELEEALNNNSARLKEANNLHDVSAAVFEIGLALSSPYRTSFINELEKLETASKTLGSDPVITTVAEVLRPIAAGGIVPYTELSERFKTVVASGRQAALVPEGGGMMGNLVAAVASKLIIPARGPVAGDTPEAIFAKAEYYFEKGELNEAVAQLAQLRGMPLSIARDWLQAASDRLVVENSVKALYSHVVVLSHQQQQQQQQQQNHVEKK